MTTEKQSEDSLLTPQNLVLSFDCGIKNLGVALLSYSPEVQAATYDEMNEEIKSKKNRINLLLYDSINISNEVKGKNTSFNRAVAVHSVLDKITTVIKNGYKKTQEDLTIAVEFQLTKNPKMRELQSFIIFYFLNCKELLQIRSQVVKNFDFGILPSKVKSEYTRKKQNATRNLERFLQLSQMELATEPAKKDDVADALLLGLVAILRKNFVLKDSEQ